MNKIIEDQLKKVKIADLSNFDYESNTYHIKQYCKPKYDLNACYLVKVPKELVKNTGSILAINWNNSTAPQFEYLKIYVSKTLGKMIYADTIGVNWETKQDINTLWSGWLNTEELTQINKL